MTVEISCETDEDIIKWDNHKNFSKSFNNVWRSLKDKEPYLYGDLEYYCNKSIYKKRKVLKFFTRNDVVASVVYDGKYLNKSDLHKVNINVYKKEDMDIIVKYVTHMKDFFETTEYNIKIEVIKNFLE